MNILLFAALLAAGQPHGPATRATDVRVDTEDKMTVEFADALRKAMPRAKHMHLETGDDKDDLYLAILWPVTEDGKRFDYAVDLMHKTADMVTPDRLASLTGDCRVTQVDSCADGVIAKPDKQAKED